jgi:ParB-like chromosome segregation protein Spo0J
VRAGGVPRTALPREFVSVAELETMAAQYNPRRISDEELTALRRSLRRFGFVEPIVANRRSCLIVGGHQRLAAARAEGLEQVPVVWVDLDRPGELQLNLALNRIGGEWDEEKLSEILGDLSRDNEDLDLTGFRSDELARLLAVPTAPEDFREPSEETNRECPRCHYRWWV